MEIDSNSLGLAQDDGSIQEMWSNQNGVGRLILLGNCVVGTFPSWRGLYRNCELVLFFLADPHCSRMKRTCQSVERPMNAVMNQASHWMGTGAVELHGWVVYTPALNNRAATDR